jgi:hypothetical protein
LGGPQALQGIILILVVVAGFAGNDHQKKGNLGAAGRPKPTTAWAL